MEKKKCSVCKETKSLTEFSKDSKRYDGRTSQCLVCRRAMSKSYTERFPEKRAAYNLKTKEKRKLKHQSPESRVKYRERHLQTTYGIGTKEFDTMMEEQNGVCAICNKHDLNGRVKYLSVDHAHDSGKVRGLLCGNCNKALGNFMDDIGLLKKAIEYLKKT